MEGIHLQTSLGQIFFLTEDNETATKELLYEIYSPNEPFHIIETDEALLLGDIFNNDNL
jgi:hypothetical protein